MAGRAKGVRGQMGEQETELQTHEAYRNEVAKSMFEEKSIYEMAAMQGISIGGARNIYTGLRTGAINNPNAEIKLLDKDSLARELQAPEAQAYLNAHDLSVKKLEKAEEDLKTAQANPAATGEQLEVAMAQLAEAKRNNDLLAKMVSKETKDGKDSYRLSGMDGKGTWQIGDLRQLSRLMWEDKGQKAAGFGADFIRQNVQFHDGYKMLPKGKSSIIPDTEVVRNWMGSKTYGQENVGGEYNRQMLTRLQHAAPGSYERMQTNADPTWTVQRKGTITRRVAQMMTHPQIAPLIPSKDMAGNVVPGGDFQQDTFSHIASMLQSKDFMYNPMTTTQERDALYKFLSRGHVDRSQAYSAQELQGMKKDYLNLINVLSASRRQAPFSEEEEEMIPGA